MLRFVFLVMMLLMAWQAQAQPPAGPDTLWVRYYGDTTGTNPTRVKESGINMDFFPNGDLMYATKAYISGQQWRGTKLRRLTTAGAVVWEQLHSFQHIGACTTPAGDILCVGDTLLGSTRYAYVVRLDDQGERLWSRVYAYPQTAIAHAVQPVADGGCWITGIWQRSQPPHGWYVLRLDSAGDTLWTRYYYRTTPACTIDLLRLRLLEDGGALIGLMAQCDNPGPTGYMVMRLDSAGDNVWLEQYPPPMGLDEDVAALSGMLPLPDGRILLTGSYTGWNGWTGWPVWVDADGILQSFFEYAWIEYPYFRLGQATPDGAGFVMTATATPWLDDREHSYLMRVDSVGNPEWMSDPGRATYAGHDGIIYGHRAWHCPDGTYLMAAQVVLSQMDYQMVALLRFAAATAVPEETSPPGLVATPTLAPPHPNPFNSTTTLRFSLPVPSEVTLTLCNVLGRVVMEKDLGQLAAGEHAERVDAERMASGIYFVNLRAGTESLVRKVALVR